MLKDNSNLSKPNLGDINISLISPRPKVVYIESLSLSIVVCELVVGNKKNSLILVISLGSNLP